jgi:hypothetical protein
LSNSVARALEFQARHDNQFFDCQQFFGWKTFKKGCVSVCERFSIQGIYMYIWHASWLAHISCKTQIHVNKKNTQSLRVASQWHMQKREGLPRGWWEHSLPKHFRNIDYTSFLCILLSLTKYTWLTWYDPKILFMRSKAKQQNE